MLKILSGCRDSNPGPPAPKAGALAGLRYIPNKIHSYCCYRRSSCEISTGHLSPDRLRMEYTKIAGDLQRD